MLRLILGWLLVALAVAVPAAGARAEVRNSYIALNYHDIPENGRKLPPFDRMAVAHRNFENHLDWLTANGYHFISIQQIIDAHAGKAVLPDKAVLLTFDDGFESFYTRVFPILKQRRIPAVEAVIGTWMRRTEKPDMPGYKPVLTWAEVREMQASGLVEIASHTDNMHDEIDADPQGEEHAAVTTRQYLPAPGRYERDAEYAARLDTGMQRSVGFIKAAIGQRPRVLVWPFGEYNVLAVAAARRAGMAITLGLSDGVNNAGGDLSVVNRLLVTDDPEVPAFAAMVTSLRADRAQRAIRVDLDTVWSANPAVAVRKQQAMIRRVQASGASAVYLQAYADPDRNGTVNALYFPNRHLPVRADLLGAFSERLKEATGAKIYAMMPARVIDAAPAAGRWAGDIYEDLAKYVAIDGLVLSSESLDYPDPAARGHTLALAGVSAGLTARMRTYRPLMKTALDINATPARTHRAQRSFDRSLPTYLRRFDYVVVNAVASRHGAAQLERLVSNIDRGVGGIDRIVFGLASRSTFTHRNVPVAVLRDDLRAMLRAGARNIELRPGNYAGPQMTRLGKVFGAVAQE